MAQKQVTITLDGKSRAVVTEKAFQEVWKPRGYSVAKAAPAAPVKTTEAKSKATS